MAVFDPQVSPGNDPQYWEWARAAQQPESAKADLSTGIALKGIGEGIEGAATIADRAMKESIAQEAQDKYGAIRDDMTKTLEAAAGRQSTESSGNPEDAMDLMPDDNKPNAPAAVDSQLSRIKSIQASRDSNKISETTYYQHLNSALKDLRSTYPGYRDYVDSETSKITGVNPANAYMAGMIKDINAQRTAQASQQNYWEKQIVNSGFSGSQQMLDEFKQTGDITKAEHWYAANNERQEGVKRQLTAFTLAEKSRSDYESKAEQAANAAAEHAATEYFFSTGLIKNDPNSLTSSKISDFVANSVAHPESIDAEKVRTYGQQLEQLKARNYLETQQVLSSVKTKTGESIADVLGPVKMKAILDAKIGGLYDTMQTSLTNQDLGLVHAVQNASTDIGSNTSLRALNDPTIGGTIRTFQMLNKLAPNMSPELMQNVVGESNIGSDLQKFSQHQFRQGVANTGGTDGKPYTFNQSGKELDNAATATSSSTSDKAKAINNLLGLSKAITEKDPAIADNAISYFFNPANKGSLNKLMDDYYDPNRGYIIKGRTSAFGQLTSEENTKAIYRRSKEGNTDAWDHYKGWAQNEAASNLTTIAKSWNDNLEMAQNNKQDSLRLLMRQSGPKTDHQFYWDSEKHQLGLMDNKGEIIPSTAWRLNTGLFAFRNANKYFENLSHIANTEGTDPDALIFSTLRQAWPLDPESQKIFQSVVASRTKPHVP